MQPPEHKMHFRARGRYKDIPDVNGKYLGDGDPDHGPVAEVEEEDVRHEQGERQPTDVGSVHVGTIRHGPA